MKMATNEPTSVMECETRHQALRFVLIVTHTRHELKSLLEYGTVGGADPHPLPITVTNYASACMHHARDVYQYIADLVEFRLRERTKVFVNLSNESLEDLLTEAWESLTYQERAACIWILLERGESGRDHLRRVFEPQASLGLTCVCS